MHPTLNPLDEHNQKLQQQVHPQNWHNPLPAERYNLVVIGAGTAGLVSAFGAAGLGAKVALIEQELMGGDCLNVGCVPSKTLIHAARLASQWRHGASVGVRGVAPQVDFAAVMRRMRRTRADISPHDSVWRAQELGVDMFLGAARFLSRSVVEVDGKHLHFHKAVIASGARPVVPAIPGLQEAGYYTNETIFSLDQPHPPRHLMVIGGGPIGCELAQAFARLGSQVTILQREPQFLPREDRDAALLLAQALQNDGISVHLACEVLEVVRQGEQRRLHLRSEGRELTIEGDAILVATGRQANVEGFGLEHAGVEYDGQRGVLVNDYLQTTNPNIYAAGDVCLSHKFTHTADAAARLVLRNALFFGRGRMSSLTIPWCTYTDPEIAHVGMYEREATARGIQLQTIQVPFQTVDRAITENATQGFLKIHVEASSDRILGATVVGEHAGDLISEITLAMVHRIGLSSIANVVHPYPTRAEALRKAADQFNRGRLTPRLRRWMSGWFSLWR